LARARRATVVLAGRRPEVLDANARVLERAGAARVETMDFDADDTAGHETFVGKVAGLVLEVKGDFCRHVRDILARHGRADDYVEISLTSRYRYNPLHNDLDAYALAASELVQGTLPVRTGIVFLRSKGAPYVERPAADLAPIRIRLLEAATSIARGRSTGAWPKVEPARCRDLGCGFFRRCHGDNGT